MSAPGDPLAHPPILPGSPRGYELSILNNGTVEGKYICVHCRYVLRNPVQSICFHRFCKDCVEFIFRTATDPKCAMCLDERLYNGQGGDEEEEDIIHLVEGKIFPDNAIKREFTKLKVFFSNEGCDWTGPFKEFEIETELSEHMQKFVVEHWEALYKRVSEIQTLIGQNEQLPQDHPAAQVTSAAGQLQLLLPRIEAIDAILKRLEAQVNEQKIKYQQTSGAGSDGVEPSGALSNLAIRFAATGGIGSRNGAFPQNGETLKSLAEIQQKMTIFEGVITVLNKEIEKLSILSDSAEHQQKADKEDVLGRKVRALERQLAMKDATIAVLELRTISLELNSYDGTLVWKISEFSRRRHEAISGQTPSIYSTPFYTSKTGYKMCARIYLNGDGMGRGTHISLFFIIMRGQHDTMLKWPFHQCVTMMFLDQNKREHILDAFRPEPTSSSFKRPMSEMNIASGFPLFLPLTQLDNPQHGYVKDNTGFLKIVVSTEEVQPPLAEF